MKSQTTEREKQVMLALANAGVSSIVIAKAFKIPRQRVAAYRAWQTIRNSK